MSDILNSAGGGTAAGAFMAWLISYIRHKDTQKEIEQRVHKDTYKADHEAMLAKIDTVDKQHVTICSIQTEALTKRLDEFAERFGNFEKRTDSKLDRLLDK